MTTSFAKVYVSREAFAKPVYPYLYNNLIQEAEKALQQ